MFFLQISETVEETTVETQQPPLTESLPTTTSSSLPEEQWSDAEIESLLLTIILFGILTSLIYNFVIKPVLFTPNPDNNQDYQRQGGQRNAPHHPTPAQQRPRMDLQNNRNEDTITPDGELLALLTKLARVPPHISSASSTVTSNILQEGVVPFRYTHASSFEKSVSSSSDQDVPLNNRRERAKIFAKLFRPPSTAAATTNTATSTSTAPPPPLRGANVVITIPISDVSSPKIHQILYLLGTYYNVFVILSIPSSSDLKLVVEEDLNKETREVELLNSYKNQLLLSLEEDCKKQKVSRRVIPAHRIIASTSSLGRVAFIRQMGKKGVHLLLDYDADVKNQLSRFGFTVLLYPEKGSGENEDGVGMSGLGDFLLP
mmetsp:Transcript_31853/g.46434  ORF Transcript_31853/g.46434 Transcript_31853/m.46434 type:complete len:374 (-) Transcript_31853:529-1650(-)